MAASNSPEEFFGNAANKGTTHNRARPVGFACAVCGNVEGPTLVNIVAIQATLGQDILILLVLNALSVNTP